MQNCPAGAGLTSKDHFKNSSTPASGKAKGKWAAGRRAGPVRPTLVPPAGGGSPIKKQLAGGGGLASCLCAGKSGSYGRKAAAQALQIPRSGPSVSLLGELYVDPKAVVDGRHIISLADGIVTVLAVALPDLPGPKDLAADAGRPTPQGNMGLWRNHGLKICKFHTKHLFIIQ